MRYVGCFSLGLCVIAGWLVLAPARLHAEALGDISPATEATAALKKLHGTSYRQRDIVTGPFAGLGGTIPPTITEHAGDRTRQVSEISVPNFGTMKSERITVGSRAAVRTTAPALLEKLEKTKSKLTVSAAKSLLQQIVSAASAVQTGGLSAASWIAEATRAAMTLKSTADARVALDHAMAGFQSWQLVIEDEDLASLPMPPEGFEEEMDVEKTLTGSGTLISYRRTPIGPMAAGFYSVLFVDAKTGFPVAEENFVNGQRIMRSEFFDIGAAITIDLPSCLEASGT
jgi:hypothetical protein